MTIRLAILLLALAGCDSLWGGFLEDNPRNCEKHGCPNGQICNHQTRRCQGPSPAGGSPDGSAPGCGAARWRVDTSLSQPNDLLRVWGLSFTQVWAVGTAGTILNWDGQAWRSQMGGQGQVLHDVGGSNFQFPWAVGQGGTILHWQDDSSWHAVASGTSKDLFGVGGIDSDPKDVWAVGGSGTLLHFQGTSWAGMSMGTQDLAAVWGSGPKDVWAVGGGGTLLHFQGTSWTSTPALTAGRLGGVWGTSKNDVWTVSDDGKILHFTGSWADAGNGPHPPLFGVWAGAPNDAWAVGLGGTILHWDGALWSSSSSGTTKTLYSVWGSGPCDVWAVGEGGTILHYAP